VADVQVNAVLPQSSLCNDLCKEKTLSTGLATKMSTCFQTFIISAAVFIALSPKGLSLKCHTCYSTKSWDDCLENSRVKTCPTFGEPYNMVCQKQFNSKLRNNSQKVEVFAKSCLAKDLCDKKKCREETVKPREYSITKASHCDVQCCSEDLCNSGTTMSKARGLSVSFVDMMIFVTVSVVALFGIE